MLKSQTRMRRVNIARKITIRASSQPSKRIRSSFTSIVKRSSSTQNLALQTHLRVHFGFQEHIISFKKKICVKERKREKENKGTKVRATSIGTLVS